MDRKKAEFLVDLQKVKKFKQKKVNGIFADLYDWMFTYVESETNLREKVRAKHLFRHKLGLETELELDKNLQLHFEHWLLFDYVTVVGSRLLDLFVRTKKTELSKEMLELSGILMLMHLEPIRVHKVENGRVIYTPLFSEDNKTLEATPYLFSANLEEGELVFARIASIGYEKKLIGPTIKIDSREEDKLISQLEAVFAKGKTVYRRYLKEYGIDALNSQKLS
ncbi:hypothetical protein CR194_11605 [Salipaludibacillus keqinensis]|jgi:hypothetical protein|uniref:Uncharacterized protein n=1 Tax=Salipaludibacillus keqinensis TaxID=2045207 RepID=A0A323TJK4_9BACI|nr:hypothetical protein [Salipaludibacillus keqinensis]PYZ93787.1 hypothetical protein CR194_11605 [Salipaludibacillus keqinensis]